MVVCSAHLTYDFEDPSSTRKCEELVCYCEEEHLYLVTECDSNARYTVWGSTNCNDRGMAMLEFLNYSNLEILNQGNDSSYRSAGRLEVTDNTLVSIGPLESLKVGFPLNLPYRITDIFCSCQGAPYQYT